MLMLLISKPYKEFRGRNNHAALAAPPHSRRAAPHARPQIRWSMWRYSAAWAEKNCSLQKIVRHWVLPGRRPLKSKALKISEIMAEEMKENFVPIEVEDITIQEEEKKEKQQPEAKAAWAALFKKPKLSASQPKKSKSSTPIVEEQIKEETPEVKDSSQINEEQCVQHAQFNQSQSSVLQKRKHSQGHAVGWVDAYQTNPLFSPWIRFDCETGLVFCDENAVDFLNRKYFG